MLYRQWENLCRTFTPGELASILRSAAPVFRPVQVSFDDYLIKDDIFNKADGIGVIELPDAQSVIVGVVGLQGELTARTSKRKQYDLVKRILKAGNHNAGIFAFHDGAGRFRLSLVTVTYHGTRRQFSTFRRYTFFVDPESPNKTFLLQMRQADFSTLSNILEIFSLEAVSDGFYNEFKPMFDDIAQAVQGTGEEGLRQDFALLFTIRIIFLGFVQKKGWLNSNIKFLQTFWDEYRQSEGSDTFYKEWLRPLFFEALSSPPGRKVAYGSAPFSKETQEALQMFPHLNGELFKPKQDVDDRGLWIPDEQISNYFDLLFQYNFTIEENELYDEELELNPEFLGIIFERLTNMDQGAVYTPREEVDLMCRLALVKWLEQTAEMGREDLYRLFFREAGTGEAYDEYQKQGDFSPAEIRTLIELLERVTVCDPAAGSGAFEVGMLQVLDQVLENLYSRNNTPEDLKKSAPGSFERKKAIIAATLYGVEVKRWAVWINHLRLWLTLFVDMPDNSKSSIDPLLPNLAFKVRTGDSLVQRVGDRTYPVQGHAGLPAGVKRKITQLKEKKRDFFYNKSSDYRTIEHEEFSVFQAVLDAEIAERRDQIRGMYRPDPEQGTLFQTGYVQTELDFSEENEPQRSALEAEIAELQARKHSLKMERPFIWSIEFAEVFYARGGFDIIIGNPPYVRQEMITDPNGTLAPGGYKDALLEMVRLDFPDYFTPSRDRPDRFRAGRKPSGRSDLYTYFYIRSLRLLNPRGVHVFICSNSWLDVGYGAWLQEFFLRRVPLHFVIDNHARRSFARADINTIITVASAPGEVNVNHSVRFVAFKQPFENVVLSDNLLEIEQAATTFRNDRFRVFPITVNELLQEGLETDPDSPLSDGEEETQMNFAQSGSYVGDKWGGKYLRAPDIFFTILEKGKGKLARLGEIATVRRGFTTGANDFFYLQPLGPGSQRGLLRVRNAAGWEGEIEEEFLKPVIKSPRECISIVVELEDLENLIFMCNKNESEIKDTKALEYIKWGESVRITIRQGTEKGEMVTGYHSLRTAKCREPWWDVGISRAPDLFMIKGPWNRHFVIANFAKAYCDQQLYGITLTQNVVANFMGYISNTTLSGIFFELEGRHNFGEGILWLAAYEIKNIRVLKDVQAVEHEAVTHFLRRPIKNIFDECGIDPRSDIPIAEQEPDPLPDRKALDDIVFDALDLTEEERKEVYRAVCRLVWERISKARSVN